VTAFFVFGGSMTKRKGVDNSQAKGTDAPSSTNNKTGDKMSPVQTQALAFVGKIESLRYEAPDFQTAKDMKTAYDAAHAEVKAGADAAMSSQADTLLALAKVQAILSQRGANKAALRKEAGLKGWEEYYAWFQKEYDYKYCLRTVQRKIEALSGVVKACNECGKETGHRKTCSMYEAPLLLTASEKRKLVDSALVAYEVVEAVKVGGNVEEAVKGLQRSLPAKDKLHDLVDNPSRITQDKVPTEALKVVKSNVEYPDLDGDLKTETISVLTEVAKQLQQGELAIKVRTLLGKLIGRPMKAESKAAFKAKKESQVPTPAIPAVAVERQNAAAV
jgi:hypothetical protein